MTVMRSSLLRRHEWGVVGREAREQVVKGLLLGVCKCAKEVFRGGDGHILGFLEALLSSIKKMHLESSAIAWVGLPFNKTLTLQLIKEADHRGFVHAEFVAEPSLYDRTFRRQQLEDNDLIWAEAQRCHGAGKKLLTKVGNPVQHEARPVAKAFGEGFPV